MNFVVKINHLLVSKTTSLLMTLMFGSLFLWLMIPTVFAQPAQYTDHKSDQTLRGSGRINASSLAMEFDLPLGSYPGRGINVPVSLSYSSKLWQLRYSGMNPGQGKGCYSTVSPIYGEKTASGWTTSLAVPYIEYSGGRNPYDQFGSVYDLANELACDPGSQTPAPPTVYVRRLTLHLPSGETHELRAGDAAGGNGAGFWEGNFYAVDGSNIMYKQDSTTGVYKALMPDGSYYEFDATSYGEADRKAVKFVDRNGNYTSYHAPTTAYPNGYWTDTLGKNIPVPFETTVPTSAPTTQTYAMPGMTGTYKFYWKNLKGNSASDSGLTVFSQDLRYLSDAKVTNGIWGIYHDEGTYLFQSEQSASLVTGYQIQFNPIVLTQIELPTGQSYKFSYNIFGEIDHIDYPTGGKEDFIYNEVGALSAAEPPFAQANRGVTSRKVYPTATSNTPYEWSYETSGNGEGFIVRTTNPDDTKTERFLHRGSVDTPFGFDNILAGMPFKELTINSTGSVIAEKLTHWTSSGGIRHPRVDSETTTVYDDSGNGVSATVKYDYEGDLSLKETPVMINKTTQYAFVAVPANAGKPRPGEEPDPQPTPVPTPNPATLTPVKITETTYLINDTVNYPQQTDRDAYKDRNMVGLVTVSTVKDGAGFPVARSETKYDEGGDYQMITAATSLTGWLDPNTNYRGNPTTARVWDSTKGAAGSASAYIATHAQFDNLGNQRKTWDALGALTQTGYDSPSGQDYKFAFPTKVTTAVPDPNPTGNPDGLAHGANAAFETTATFDPTTGLPLTTTDTTGLETRIQYDPVTLRPLNTKTYYQNNQIGSQSETIYHDEPNNYWVKSRTLLDTNKWAESIAYFDGLGRAYKSEQADAHGNIFVEKEFDAEGRVKRVTNPFRAGDTKYWTTNVYDEASRVKEVQLPDGAKVKTDYGVATAAGAPIGITKQITDQANRKRKGITDVLGRMVRVIEDPDSAAFITNYTFDTLGNLRKTEQGEQLRYFSYDSLGRLLRAKQPEQDVNPNLALATADAITGNNQWTVKYEYDNNGNIISTTDAKNVSVAATYDRLNRLIFRNYSDATPDVYFFYDGTGLGLSPSSIPASFKGKTTKVTSSVSETRYTSFDDLGRLTGSEQRTTADQRSGAQAPYASSYAYNLSGALVSETYPSGRVVVNQFDQDGELASVAGQKPSLPAKIYLSDIAYNAAGAVEKARLGNGRWESAQYNSRMQVAQIALGYSNTDKSLLKIDYGYASSQTATDNNGSLREQKIAYAGLANRITQSYAYDNLNRLQSATELSNTNQQTWKQTFSYDRYGNRRFETTNGGTTTLSQTTATKITNPQINPADNRLTKDQDNDNLTDYDYDQNGNLTLDAENQRFVYDAENHQTKFFLQTNSTTTPDAVYEYDGEGKRVRKITAQNETVFVYNGAGQLVAEYATQITSTPQVSYLTMDHLDSPRIITDGGGAVIARHDYTAFGSDVAETIGAVGGRTASQGYDSIEQVRQGYTGYENDEESKLDYAQARYYNSAHGRFTSVDPLTASANIKDPQTFNRYSYVLNSPYKFSDPLGLLPLTSAGACGQFCRNGGGQVDGSSFSGWYELPHTGLQDQMQADHNTDVVRLQTIQAMPTLLFDDVVPESSTERAKYNCLAWALGFTDVWIEPIFVGAGGRREGGYVEIRNRKDEKNGDKEYLPIGETGRNTLPYYSMLDVAEAYGAKEKVKVNGEKIKASKTSETPDGYYKMVVFEDKDDFTKTHVMRQDTDGTWSSKDGDKARITGIKDPEKHFKQGPHVDTTYLFRETKKLGKR